jgi:hypothetical protein
MSKKGGEKKKESKKDVIMINLADRIQIQNTYLLLIIKAKRKNSKENC